MLHLQCTNQARILPRIRNARFYMSKLDRAKICSTVNKDACKKKRCEYVFRHDEMEKPKKEPFKSMWANPECCLQICEDVDLRFDELYYETTDKTKKNYRRTWPECPEYFVKPRKVCRTSKKICPPPLKKRVKPTCQIAQCPDGSLTLKVCNDPKAKSCPRIMICGCKKARYPPKCTRKIVGPSGCIKKCTPYPAFSECSRRRKKINPLICSCLDKIPLCMIQQELAKQQAIKKMEKTLQELEANRRNQSED